MNITTVNFGVLLDSLGCINHAAAVLKRSTQPKMKPKEKPQKKILLALLFLCQIAFAQNYSLSFDGVDDYVAVSGPIATFSDQISFSGWLLVNDSTKSRNPLFGKWPESGTSFGHSLYLGHYNDGGNSIVSFAINLEDGSRPEVFGGTIKENYWHYIVGTKDESHLRLYVDGVIVGEISASGNISNPDGSTTLGSYDQHSEHFLSGKIDETAIWNTELSVSEIQSYMSSSPTGSENGLVGYWNFNEGTGTTLTDQTSNGNDGTIYGATWSDDVPVFGCTDAYASNYNSDATINDGSCTGYPDNGEYSLSFDGEDD